MTIKELNDLLARFPDDTEVHLQDGFNVSSQPIQSVEYEERLPTEAGTAGGTRVRIAVLRITHRQLGSA